MTDPGATEKGNEMSVKVYEKLREHGAPELPDGWSYRIKRVLSSQVLRVSINDASLFASERAAQSVMIRDGVDLYDVVAAACRALHGRIELDDSMDEIVGKHP